MSRMCILLVALIAIPFSAHAQSLDQYDATIEIPSAERAAVRLELRVTKAGEMRFSRVASEIGTVEETITNCGGQPVSTRTVSIGEQLFPALAARGLADCSIVRLAYDVTDPSRIPLLLPDVKLNPNAFANLEVRTPLEVSREGMPRLEWNGGVGKRQMRHLPAFVSVTLGPQRIATFTNAVNGLALMAVVLGLLVWNRQGRNG
jgi:hypothetical protein